jgi:predicted nucleic acid-binding protein
VLIPSRLRDFLLSLAAERLFRPVWNPTILAELAYHERERHKQQGLSSAEAARIADRLVGAMTRAFNDAQAGDLKTLRRLPHLPDPNDDHVLATAIKERASAIVTDNVKDFPSHVVPPTVAVLTPADATARLARQHPEAALRALTTMSARLYRPPMSPHQILDYLVQHNGLTETANVLRPLM